MGEPVLKIEINELENSIAHLERSNRELKEQLSVDPDPEYRKAIGENITTLAKKRSRLAALQEELRRLTGENEMSSAVAVPISDADDAPGSTDAMETSTSQSQVPDSAFPGTSLTAARADQPVSTSTEQPSSMDLDTQADATTGGQAERDSEAQSNAHTATQVLTASGAGASSPSQPLIDAARLAMGEETATSVGNATAGGVWL